MTRINNEHVDEEASASAFTVIVESQEGNEYTTQASALPQTKNLNIKGLIYRTTHHQDGSITCKGNHEFTPQLRTAIKTYFPYLREGDQLKSTAAGNYWKAPLRPGRSVASDVDVGDESSIGIQLGLAGVELQGDDVRV